MTLYLDLGGACRPQPDLRLFAHFGALTPVAGRVYAGSRRERYDISAGAALNLRNAELRLSLIHSAPLPANPNFRKLESDAAVVGATYAF